MRHLAIFLVLTLPLFGCATENNVGLGLTSPVEKAVGLGVSREAVIEKALEAGYLNRDDFAVTKPNIPALAAYAAHKGSEFVLIATGDPGDVHQVQMSISALTRNMELGISTAGDILSLIAPDHPAPDPNIVREMPNASDSTRWAGQNFIEVWQAWPGRGARKGWRIGQTLVVFEGYPPELMILTIAGTDIEVDASSSPPEQTLTSENSGAPDTLWTDDYETSLATIRPLATAGNADAQYELGNAYYFGWGVQVSYTEAVHWYRSAAKQGHELAQLYLGKGFPHGSGIRIDAAEKLRWLGMAADQGNAEAYYELAAQQSRDPRDADMAARSFTWCAISANLGNGLGQSCLARRFETGHGVERDLVRALMWATIAASTLEPGLRAMDAVYMQADYRERLSRNQIADAEEKAAAWMPRPYGELKSLCDSKECAIWR